MPLSSVAMAAQHRADNVDSPGDTALPVRVWDLPTRIFHWLLVGCVIGSVTSAKIGGNAMDWHFRFGYVVFTLLAFRLIWGLIGGRWSRFANFAVSPAGVLRYLRGGPTGGQQQAPGHNPLGALSVLAMLILLCLQVGSGLFADDEIASSGPLVSLVSGATSSSLTTWHKLYGQWLVLGLIGIHIAAILFYLVRMKLNLTGPMITGDKLSSPQTAASADGWRQRVLAVFLVGLCAGMVSLIWRLGAIGAGG